MYIMALLQGENYLAVCRSSFAGQRETTLQKKRMGRKGEEGRKERGKVKCAKAKYWHRFVPRNLSSSDIKK